ncbi:M20/M25/M40 family metallo-hydrolase [Cellulomonas biazotea]|uniref:M20/M25/M40 family metallo-hydrolase n=1 Tax=Cellulomonas biazotea TaxID=1709 RepID=UPI00103094A0|nr:M20/M25/M40 family metallo-hydrolase [Cellulomonas biazotea]
MLHRRKLTVLVSALVLAGAAVATPAAALDDPARHGHGHGPTAPEKFVKKVSERAVYRHLQELQRIADRNDGNRAALTPGYEASARYVEKTLRKAGYTTTRDPFTFDLEVVDAATLTVAGGETYDVDQMTFAVNTPVGGITAPLALPAAPDTLGCTAADWAGTSVAGSIALVSRGGCTFAIKVTNAEAAGAVGVAVYNNVPDVLLNGTLGAEGIASVPAAGLTQADGQALAAQAAAGPVTVTLDTRAHPETRESFNVIAQTRAGRTDNVVMLGAHLDGVEDGPGINDNGTGSAVLLETAVQLGKDKRLPNAVRFAWWGAEELGLIGSTAYVEDLVAQPGEIDKIATYLNFDMVGSPNYIIGVYDADQSTHPAPVPVPPGSAETEDVLTGWFDSIGQPWVDTQFSGRSDYQAFILNGVPASGLFTGADGVKTDAEVALFGGTAGITHDPNYHSPGDDLSNVNRKALRIMTAAVAYATYSLALDTSAVNGVESPTDPRPGHGHGPGKGRNDVGRNGHQEGWDRAA